jgi:uncharacterized membrane protein YbaN (DUF454 family)
MLRAKEVQMGTLFVIIVLAFVVLVLAVVAFALFELTPFARDSDAFRDPLTGRRRWESPHLD